MNSFGDVTRDWANIPWDPLFRIIESSFSLSDYIRFGAVCIQWRFFYVQNYDRINELFSRRPPLFLYTPKEDPSVERKRHVQNYDSINKLFSRRPPLFLYTPKEDRSLERKHETSIGRVSSFLDRKTYNDVQLRSLKQKCETSTGRVSSFLDRKAYYDVQFPSLCFKNFHGSSHGWLVTVDKEKPYSVRLLNPFFNRSSSTAAAKNVIQLPPLCQTTDWSAYKFDYPNKVVLSASPLSNPKSFVAMATLIRGSKLSFYPSGLRFCRPGDSAWTSLPFEGKVFDDVVYYKGKFYVVEDTGALISIDFGDCYPHSDNEPKIVRIIDPCPRTVASKMYLVESSGHLLLVCKFHYASFIRFYAFKLDRFAQWVKMKTLEDRILFLSIGGSMSICASDYPGFKPNYIYHAALCGGQACIRIFNFEHSNSELLSNSKGGRLKSNYDDMSPGLTHAIWFQPSL